MTSGAVAYLLVGAGGAAGAMLRHAAGAALGPLALAAGWPVSVALINVLGSFALGLLLTLVGREVLPDWARLAFGTGLLGGFTTFSTFSVDADGLLQRGAYGELALYVGLSVGGGMVAAAAGRLLGLWLTGGAGQS